MAIIAQSTTHVKAGELVGHGHSIDTYIRHHYGRHAVGRITKRNANGSVVVMVTRPGAIGKQGSSAHSVVDTIVVRGK